LIPPIPERESIAVDHFTPQFIEGRRRDLEKFLNRVLAHPQLKACKHVQEFLSKPQLEGVSLFETLTEFANEASMGVPFRPNPKEVEPWFDETELYVAELEFRLKALHLAVTQITQKTMEMHEVWSTFADSADVIANYEREHKKAKYHLFLSQLSTISLHLSGLEVELATETEIKVSSVFKDYTRLYGAVQELLINRKYALLTYENASHVRDAKEESLNSHKHEESRVLDYAKDFFEAEYKLQIEKEMFTKASEECKKEIQEFITTRTKELMYALGDFAQLTVDHTQKMYIMWKDLFSAIENRKEKKTTLV